MPSVQYSRIFTQGDAATTTETKPVVLQHPFTMMISGPTACGKTTFVKDLLQHHNTRIQPTVQRIVWLYKRWQPLYGVIQSTVYPEVEFYQGIPSDINEDEYFDTKLNNLLIMDDMMSEAGKDKRITDLFTEGSHHRSLSVISINQNLYASKDPTQRRNCHYLVMFNNPVDKQSMITLARQMYPGKSEYFLKKFEKATKQPYGCLLVDLKPFTPEHARLKYDLMWIDRKSTNNESLTELTNQITESDRNCIKGEQQSDLNHLSVGSQTVDIAGYNCEIMAENTNACGDCGLLFDSSHDVQRHVKRGWCAENNDTTQPKKRKIDDSSDGEMEDNVEENQAYLSLLKKTINCNDDKYDILYNQFIQDGEDEESAQEMTEDRIQPYNERTFFTKYKYLLDSYILPLQNSTLHQKILQDIHSLTQKHVSTESAIKRVLRKYKPDFKELFETELSDEEIDEDGEEDESDTE
ncbi:uncharacterized protein LOC123531554 [Mercenaria mercenaria]|uniref:uncharacterized protein LOC123531554 n=1 Tax=Mercenaria mercenaria TaxID=6596 RepID=UPI00234F3D83|nr:uncharacterized protein LOC123531554 [Mercenaria mercenaria]